MLWQQRLNRVGKPVPRKREPMRFRCRPRICRWRNALILVLVTAFSAILGFPLPLRRMRATD
ncbi:Uncharacterised protein [Vibrio cholerae]|nr:Uncharacterised protein [Vibrio cholerae]